MNPHPNQHPISGELALIPREAARRLGVSVDFFRDWIEPSLNVIRIGKGTRLRTLVPVSELEKWVERQSMIGR